MFVLQQAGSLHTLIWFYSLDLDSTLGVPSRVGLIQAQLRSAVVCASSHGLAGEASFSHAVKPLCNIEVPSKGPCFQEHIYFCICI